MARVLITGTSSGIGLATAVAFAQAGHRVYATMARRIEHPPNPSQYPQQRRFGALFTASLKSPASPSVVAEKVVDIVDSGTWQLRHPVGPDAEAFLGWRGAMNDEEWVAWGALDDDAWYDRVKAGFGMDARPDHPASEIP